jgi:hypothetical protein
MLRPEHPASISIAVMYSLDPLKLYVGVAPTADFKGASIDARADGEPQNTPPICPRNPYVP